MGAERDEAPKPRRHPTEPGLGAPHESHDGDASEPEAVDFDALHAALGDPLALDELPHEEHDDGGYDDESYDDGGHEEQEEEPEEEPEDEGEDFDVPESEPHVGESQGRSSAQYASSRPHTIPPSMMTTEDINAPPVIVASEDIGATVPSGPPMQMTKPINQTRPIAMTPQSGVPFVQVPTPASASGPHQVAAAVPYETGPAFEQTPTYPRSAAQMTVRMPDRPIGPPPSSAPNPRRGKVQTLVVRPRGPSAKQKLFAFMAMLLLVTASGIAFVIWKFPGLIGLDSAPAPTVTTPTTATVTASGPAVAPTSAPTETATATAMPSVSSTASAVPTASLSARTKPKPPGSAPAASH